MSIKKGYVFCSTSANVFFCFRDEKRGFNGFYFHPNVYYT